MVKGEEGWFFSSIDKARDIHVQQSCTGNWGHITVSQTTIYDLTVQINTHKIPC